MRKRKYIQQQLLEEWRGLPQRYVIHDYTTSKQALEKLLSKIGLANRIDEEELRQEWESIVGSFIASNSFPSSIRKKVLVIQTQHPTVRYELDRFWKQKILDKLSEKFRGKIQEIRVV